MCCTSTMRRTLCREIRAPYQTQNSSSTQLSIYLEKEISHTHTHTTLTALFYQPSITEIILSNKLQLILAHLPMSSKLAGLESRLQTAGGWRSTRAHGEARLRMDNRRSSRWADRTGTLSFPPMFLAGPSRGAVPNINGSGEYILGKELQNHTAKGTDRGRGKNRGHDLSSHSRESKTSK